jgi:hypothetical protein
MASGTTFDDLMKFLDYMLDKGLLNRNTAVGRKAVVGKVFQALDAEARQDVLAVDVDDVMNRFINKAGSNYTPDSLQTYKSRLKSVLDDFRAYKTNPMGFRPTVAIRSTKQKVENPRQKTPAADDGIQQEAPRQQYAPHASIPSDDILPVKLRPDLVVRIQGLPHDLTSAEANRLCTVLRAFVADE